MGEEYKVLAHGVKWGVAEIEFVMSDPKLGRMLEIRTETQRLQIRVTPGGRFRTSIAKKSRKGKWDNRFQA